MPPSTPTKCSASDKYSLYSEDNLSKLRGDFSKLSEVEVDNQRPFKECSKRLEREQEQVRNDQNKLKYRDEYSTNDEKSIKLRFQFFNRTLCPILLDPSKVEENIPTSLKSSEPPDEDDIERQSQWKKKKYAEQYFDSLLDKYESERREILTENTKKKKKTNNHYSDENKERDLNFESQHEEFMKKFKGKPKEDFLSGSAMSLLWTQFNSQIRNPSDETTDVIPNTDIMSQNGLESLLKLVQAISSTVYHKNKIEFLENTDKFLREYVGPLSKFFKERLYYLSTFKDYNKSNDKKSDDDDDYNSSKVGRTKDEEYSEKKWGYTNVAIGCLKLLIGAIKLDVGTIERQSDDEQQESVFTKMADWFKRKIARKNENISELDPSANGVKLCLLKLIDKAYEEHKMLVNFQQTEFGDRKKDKDNSKELNHEFDEQTGTDKENSDIYSFISGLTNGKIEDFETNKKPTEKELVGKNFISLRAKLRLLNDCLDPRFSYNENGDELKKLTKVRKDVKTLLDDVDLKKLGIGSIQDVIDTFKDSKKMNEIKDKINGVNDKIVNKMKESNIKNFIESNNDQFAKCKKMYNEELSFQKIPADINDANENLKSYASFSEQDYKNFFEKELKALKLPDTKKLSLKLIKEIDDDNNTKGKGQEYLKYHAILSFVYQFLDVNQVEANDTNKDKVEYRKHFLNDIIKGSIEDESQEFPDKQQIFDSNNIFDISYDYEEKDKIKKEIVKLTDSYEDIIKLIEFNALKEYRYKNENNEEQIEKVDNDYFSKYETNIMKEKITQIENCFQNGRIDNIDKFNALDEKIRPYIIYDKILMDKERKRIESEKTKHDESTKLEENKKKFGNLADNAQKKWLIDRAKLGFLYLFFKTNPFKNSRFFMSSIEKEKYEASQRKNINEIEELLGKIDIDKILNKSEGNNLDDKLKAKLENVIKDDSNIKDTWTTIMEYLTINEKTETKKYSELYTKLSQLNDYNLNHNDDLSKFIFFSKSDWDSEISKYKGNIEKYKETKEIKDKFENKQELLKKQAEENKIKTYKALITNGYNKDKVKQYLLAKMRLNLIKIYLETNLLGMDYPTDKKLREKIDSTKSIYVDKINELHLNGQNSVNDVYDILNPPKFEEKKIDDNLLEEEKRKAKAEQEKKKKDYEEESEKKKETLLNKYSSISASAKNIINHFVKEKVKWFNQQEENKNNKNDENEANNISKEDVEYLTGKKYPIQNNLKEILIENTENNKDDKNNQDIAQKIIDGNYEKDKISVELLKNCMSYDEEDFKKELEKAKKIQKDRQI